MIDSCYYFEIYAEFFHGFVFQAFAPIIQRPFAEVVSVAFICRVISRILVETIVKFLKPDVDSIPTTTATKWRRNVHQKICKDDQQAEQHIPIVTPPTIDWSDIKVLHIGLLHPIFKRLHEVKFSRLEKLVIVGGVTDSQLLYKQLHQIKAIRLRELELTACCDLGEPFCGDGLVETLNALQIGHLTFSQFSVQLQIASNNLAKYIFEYATSVRVVTIKGSGSAIRFADFEFLRIFPNLNELRINTTERSEIMGSGPGPITQAVRQLVWKDTCVDDGIPDILLNLRKILIEIISEQYRISREYCREICQVSGKQVLFESPLQVELLNESYSTTAPYFGKISPLNKNPPLSEHLFVKTKDFDGYKRERISENCTQGS